MANSNFYPDWSRLWRGYEAHRTGVELRYTPDQLRAEFLAYLADLADHPMEWEVEFRKLKQGGSDSRESQVRRQKLCRPPKVTDFVTRWLGMSLRWWSELDNNLDAADYAVIKAAVREYCAHCMLDGAAVGVYSSAIVSRYLGMAQRIELVRPDEDRSPAEIDAEIARWRDVVDDRKPAPKKDPREAARDPDKTTGQ